MKKYFLYVILVLLVTNKAFGHGNHGGGTDVSIEGDLASGNHIHLPVRVEATGEVVFGYEWPFSEHEHEHEHEHDEHEHDEHDAEEESGEHSFHIAPTAIIGGDYIDRIISKDSLPGPTVGMGEVFNSKNENGFVHIKSSKLLLGLGIEIHKHLNVGAFGGGLGLVYAKNHASYSEVHLKTLQEKGREIKLPGNFNEFSAWRNEEKISYVTSGSIIFNAGVGLDPIVHGGVIASASGTWLVKLKKIDQDHLNVSVASIKAYSFGVEVDSVIVSLSREKLKSAEKSLNFNINMKSPKVVDALKQIYKGDFRAIQKLAADEEFVTETVSSQGVSKGTGGSVNLNFPFLFGVGTSKYLIDSYQTSLKNKSEQEGLAYSSIISRDETTKGILSNHKKEIDQFATTFIDEQHDDHRDKYYAANFKWHYEKDEVKVNVVKSKLAQLALQTGIEKLKELKFTQDNLGHFRISFDVSFTESDMFSVLNLLSDDKDLSALRNSAWKNVDSYLKENSYQDLCPRLNDRNSFGDKKAICAEELKSKTDLLLDKLNKLAKRTVGDIKNKNPQSAVTGFSEIGTLMVRNQFVFKELIQGLLDTEISLSVEGEKVIKQKMIL